MKTIVNVEVECIDTDNEAFAAGMAYAIVSQALTDISLPEGFTIVSVNVDKPMPVIVREPDPPIPPPPPRTEGDDIIPF